MTDDIMVSKLPEAGEYFTTQNYAECLKALSACPSDDPKVMHNTALVQYLHTGKDSMQTLQNLKKAPLRGHSSDAGSSSNPPSKAIMVGGRTDGISVGDFTYGGHEVAHYNRACVMLHNGLVDEAVTVLRDLLGRKPPIDPSVQVRCGVLFQLATGIGKNNKKRTAEDDSMIAKLAATAEQDPVTKKLFTLATANSAPAVQAWFKGSGQTVPEKIIYYNNLGIHSMNEGKAHIASVYFSHALRHMEECSIDKFIANSVWYNAGVCALLRKEYSAAVKALLLAQETMSQSPLLWMRLAQSALGVHLHFASQAVATAHSAAQDSLANALTVTDTCRLMPGLPLLQVPSALALYGCNTDANGCTALDTVLRAIDNTVSLLVPPGVTAVSAADKLHNSGQTSLVRVLQYALCYGAFVELQRCNYSVAAAIGQEVLGMHRVHPLQADVHVSIACYTVEALLQLGKAAAAFKVLQAVHSSDLVSTDAQDKGLIMALFMNLVTTHIANGSWKAAHSIVSTLVAKYASSESNTVASKCAAILQVYVELALGNRDKALDILRKQPIALPAL